MWETWWCKGLRWLVFLPITLSLGWVLYVVPVLAVSAAASYSPEPTMLMLIIIVAVAGALSWIPFVWMWWVGGSVYLGCGIIAPSPKIASVLYLLVLLVLELSRLERVLESSKIGIAYVIFFDLLLLYGAMLAFTVKPEVEHEPT